MNRPAPALLDDTPWYLDPRADNRRGTERSLGFCDPYGYETDDIQVMGGMRDPNAERVLWRCQNYAQGRYLMTCSGPSGPHTGRVLLCYAHVYMIQHHHSRQKNGLCPRCAWPPRARELDERLNGIMRRLADPRLWPDERQRLASALADCQAEMTEMWQRGTITTGAPLRLTEVS